MEVKSKNDGILTNKEVYDLLNQKKKKESIQNDVIKYLSKCPTINCSIDSFREYCLKIDKLNLNLSESEIVQMTNLIPIRDVEMYLIVSENSEIGDLEVKELINCSEDLCSSDNLFSS